MAFVARARSEFIVLTPVLWRAGYMLPPTAVPESSRAEHHPQRIQATVRAAKIHHAVRLGSDQATNCLSTYRTVKRGSSAFASLAAVARGSSVIPPGDSSSLSAREYGTHPGAIND